MLNLSSKSRKWEYLLRTKNVTFWAFAWMALSLFTYIFFGGPAQGSDRPFWYRIFTAYILQNVPTLLAGILCIRNGLNNRISSGKQVWLLMGIALFSYFCGNIFFSSWELVWDLSSTGSLGDPFFVLFYFCLSLAMILAIVSNQVRLRMHHWSIVIGICIYAAMIATWILKPPATSSAASVSTPVVAISQPQTSRASSASGITAPTLTPAESESTPDAPGWVMFFDGMLKPYGQNLNIFYVWCDVFLFALATAMIFAFWDGRLSSAWRINVQAIICYYIADMWFAYAGNQIKDYQGGFLLEVFWILGALHFCVAAATEFDHMVARQKFVDSEQQYFNQ